MGNKQEVDHNEIFAASLRKLMECHPDTGKEVSPSDLAQVLGTSTQTISYYVNGKRTPNYANIITLCEYFHVSADYLLFGLESDNRALNEQTGLSNDAINMLVNAYNTGKNPGAKDVTVLLSELLSDRDFYEFIEDVTFHAESVRKLENMGWHERDKAYPGIDMLGYSKWSLMEEIQHFVFSQLKKRELAPELKKAEEK